MNPDSFTTHDGEVSAEEQQLIAFHLGEPSDERLIGKRLETDPAYAALSESIAHTLQVFSARPVPASDPQHAWQRLRSTLPAMESRPNASRWRWFTFVPIAALALFLFVADLFLNERHPSSVPADKAAVVPRSEAIPAGATESSTEYLDGAERWLTVVNHATAPLDDATRAEGQRLLMRNARYVQEARRRGDLPEAVVLDRLGRVLISASHTARDSTPLRVKMNTDDLLFQLRVVRQNQS